MSSLQRTYRTPVPIDKRTTSSAGRRLYTSVSAHHEDGTVRVSDDALGGAPQDGPPQGGQAPTADDHDSYTQLLAEVDDLLGRAAQPEVSLGYLAARGPYPLRLLV